MLSHKDLAPFNSLLTELKEPPFLILCGLDLQVLALGLIQALQMLLLDAIDLQRKERLQNVVQVAAALVLRRERAASDISSGTPRVASVVIR